MGAIIFRPNLWYNWRAGASQPSRTTGTIFLFIYIILSLSTVVLSI